MFSLGLALTLFAAGARGPSPTVAPEVADGLAFAMTFSADGRVLSGESFELRVPGSEGRLRLSFEQVTVAGRRFVALARLRNDTGRRLLALGLRLGEGGPVDFADLASGRESEGRPVEGAIPEATGLSTLLGRLTGVAEAGGFDVEGLEAIAAVETDAAGNLLVIGASGEYARLSPDGRPLSPVSRRAARAAKAAVSAAAPTATVARDVTGASWRVVESGGGAYAVEGRDARDALVARFAVPGESRPLALVAGRDRRLYVVRATGGRDGTAVLVYRVL